MHPWLHRFATDGLKSLHHRQDREATAEALLSQQAAAGSAVPSGTPAHVLCDRESDSRDLWRQITTLGWHHPGEILRMHWVAANDRGTKSPKVSLVHLAAGQSREYTRQ